MATGEVQMGNLPLIMIALAIICLGVLGFLEMKKLLEDWLEFFKTLGRDRLFAGIKIGDSENKLAEMLNFKYIGSTKDMNVYSYEG